MEAESFLGDSQSISSICYSFETDEFIFEGPAEDVTQLLCDSSISFDFCSFSEPENALDLYVSNTDSSIYTDLEFKNRSHLSVKSGAVINYVKSCNEENLLSMVQLNDENERLSTTKDKKGFQKSLKENNNVLKKNKNHKNQYNKSYFTGQTKAKPEGDLRKDKKISSSNNNTNYRAYTSLSLFDKLESHHYSDNDSNMSLPVSNTLPKNIFRHKNNEPNQTKKYTRECFRIEPLTFKEIAMNVEESSFQYIDNLNGISSSCSPRNRGNTSKGTRNIQRNSLKLESKLQSYRREECKLSLTSEEIKTNSTTLGRNNSSSKREDRSIPIPKKINKSAKNSLMLQSIEKINSMDSKGITTSICSKDMLATSSPAHFTQYLDKSYEKQSSKTIHTLNTTLVCDECPYYRSNEKSKDFAAPDFSPRERQRKTIEDHKNIKNTSTFEMERDSPIKTIEKKDFIRKNSKKSTNNQIINIQNKISISNPKSFDKRSMVIEHFNSQFALELKELMKKKSLSGMRKSGKQSLRDSLLSKFRKKNSMIFKEKLRKLDLKGTKTLKGLVEKTLNSSGKICDDSKTCGNKSNVSNIGRRNFKNTNTIGHSSYLENTHPTFGKALFDTQSKPIKTKKSNSCLIKETSFLIDDEDYHPKPYYKPAKWVNADYYKFLLSKLKPIYDIDARIQSIKFTAFFYSKLILLEHEVEDISKIANEIKTKIHKIGLCKNYAELFYFLHNYVPERLRTKLTNYYITLGITFKDKLL